MTIDSEGSVLLRTLHNVGWSPMDSPYILAVNRQPHRLHPVHISG